jgi:hypothetical protein
MPLERGADAGAAAHRGEPSGALRGPASVRSRGGGLWAGLAAARPDPRPAETAWRRTWQWVVAAGVAVLLAWLTYSRGGWIPVLSAFDLGVHEFGHLLTMWAPALLCSLAGSLLQVGAPLLLGVYFWWRRDQLAVIVMLAWAAENLHNVSVYIGDAQVMILPLFGDDGSGAGHDWHNILCELGLVSSTELLAGAARAGSIALFAVAFALAALGCARAHSSAT